MVEQNGESTPRSLSAIPLTEAEGWPVEQWPKILTLSEMSTLPNKVFYVTRYRLWLPEILYV